MKAHTGMVNSVDAARHDRPFIASGNQHLLTEFYILENTKPSPPPGGKYQPMAFGGKNMKGGR
jgi:hypothetical protein